MFGLGGKQKNLDLVLPDVEQPILGASPSARILAIGGRRSWAYGLLFAAILSILFNILFAALMISRIEVIPYVADGSSYGCSPQIHENVAPSQAPVRTPLPMGLGDLAPMNVDIEGDN